MYKGMTLAEQEQLYIEACVAYNEGKPIMTDVEFDALEQALAGSPVVEKTHDEHAGATIDEDTFSIRPLHEERLVMEWLNGNTEKEFLASLKIDGVLAKVQTGRNMRAESRGRDGNTPWDYTTALSYILPKLDKQHFVRGEVFLPEEHLEYFREKYSDKIYKVSRSAAISILRRPQDHTVEDIKKLKFMAYYIDGIYSTKHEMFKHLEELGFETPLHRVVTFENGTQPLEELLDFMSSATDPADGVVVEVNDLSVKAEVDGKYLTTQIAVKVGKWRITQFTGKVVGVSFTPGKGHYGVVLEIVPVVMPDGITQTNINTFNIGVIIRSKIGKGTLIKFERQSNGMCYYKGVVE